MSEMIRRIALFGGGMRAFNLALVTVVLALPLGAANIEVRVATAAGAAVPDAVVYAVPPKPLPLAKRVAVMDQVNRTFVPHVLPVQTGTWVEFPNSDNVRHQVYSLSPTKRFQLPLYIGKPARPIQFQDAGIVAIGCNVHDQMNAFIVVVDTPFFATAEEGRATIRDLRAGQYTLRVWYPGMRDEPKPQMITVGTTDLPASFVVN